MSKITRRGLFGMLSGVAALLEIRLSEVRADPVEIDPLGSCEVCGKPASWIVNDLREIAPVRDESGMLWQTWEHESSHAFCDTHNRPEREYRRSASGGPVTVGTPYLFGERGCETFVPCSTETLAPGTYSVDVTTNLIDQSDLERAIADSVRLRMI